MTDDHKAALAIGRSESKAVRDAYQVPVGELFFGKLTGAQMVKKISAGLSAAPH